MNIKYAVYIFCLTFIYPTLGFSMERITCSFRDSQNILREFVLKRNGENNEMFMESDKTGGPYWKIMSDDKSKLILFKETQRPTTTKEASVYTVFFIDKQSGSFRFRNYVQTEYINTIIGKCQFK